MATVATTIGTDGRDYSTISAWESDLSSHDLYDEGDVAEGNCYADSDFVENVALTGSCGCGFHTSVVLTADPSQRHDGTAGSGVVLRHSGPGSYTISVNEDDITVSWIEINGNDNAMYGWFCAAGITGIYVQNCLVHNFGSSSPAANPVYLLKNLSPATFTNNFIFNNTSGSGADLFIHYSGTTFWTFLYNNTYYYNNVGNSGIYNGYIFFGSLNHESSIAKNIVILRYDNNYWDAIHASATLDYWGAAGSIAGVSNVTTDTYANSFINTSTSDPDLHLKAGCNFIGTAVDVGTTPTNVEIDINANNRDSAGVTWDLGAHEFELPIAITGKKIKPNARFNLFHGVEAFESFSTHYNF